jgi:hypothetical protein
LTQVHIGSSAHLILTVLPYSSTLRLQFPDSLT